MKKLVFASLLTLGAGVLTAGLPNVDAITLKGTYSGHLQDVWFDGTSLYWGHTADIVRTDLEGNVLARVTIAANHHAGLEVRNGRVYTAICPMSFMNVVGGVGETKVVVGEYDAQTLQLVTNHVTTVDDRAGSLAMLDDGTFLVGCLRQADMRVDEVRYHHLDAQFNLIESIRVPGAPVMMGIEVLKQRGPFSYLCLYGIDAANRDLAFNTIKVDPAGREVWRGTVGGDRGLVFDGDDVWVGESDSTSAGWSSRLVRKRLDLPRSFSAVPHRVRGRVQSFDVYFDAETSPRALYMLSGNDADGWTRLARIADIPAGATRALGVSVPSHASTHVRFLLDAKPLGGAASTTLTEPILVRADDSAAYVSDGLIAQWDGIDNAGRGVHDAGAGQPVELVNGLAATLTGTMPAGADHFTLGSGYLTFNAPAVVAACNAGHATVEVLMASDGATVHNGGILAFGDTTRAFWIYERSNGETRHLIGDFTYHGAIAGDFQGLNVLANGATNLYSFALGTTDSRMRIDGADAATLQRFAIDCPDAVCRIGSLGERWAGTRARAKIFSIRVYDRLLTAADRARNREVDELRFLSRDAPPVSLQTVVIVR